MNLFKLSLFLYALNVISVVLHELAHLTAALMVFGEFDEFSIGNLIPVISTKKYKVSPIVFSGYVGVNRDRVIESGYRKLCLFYLSGPVVTLLLGVIMYFGIRALPFRLIGIYNLLSALLFLIPCPGTDMWNLIKVIRYKRIREI